MFKMNFEVILSWLRRRLDVLAILAFMTVLNMQVVGCAFADVGAGESSKEEQRANSDNWIPVIRKMQSTLETDAPGNPVCRSMRDFLRKARVVDYYENDIWRIDFLGFNKTVKGASLLERIPVPAEDSEKYRKVVRDHIKEVRGPEYPESELEKTYREIFDEGGLVRGALYVSNRFNLDDDDIPDRLLMVFRQLDPRHAAPFTRETFLENLNVTLVENVFIDAEGHKNPYFNTLAPMDGEFIRCGDRMCRLACNVVPESGRFECYYSRYIESKEFRQRYMQGLPQGYMRSYGYAFSRPICNIRNREEKRK